MYRLLLCLQKVLYAHLIIFFKYKHFIFCPVIKCSVNFKSKCIPVKFCCS
nr:MAG TPA: hypothetical protein [Caudoviricetes sp.]DAV50123.1 MAG TPA: hypothetical protein [Caudoviricetes sp.]